MVTAYEFLFWVPVLTFPSDRSWPGSVGWNKLFPPGVALGQSIFSQWQKWSWNTHTAMVKCSHIWNSFQNWCIGLPMSPGILESWLERTEKSPWAENFPRSYRWLRREGIWALPLNPLLSFPEHPSSRCWIYTDHVSRNPYTWYLGKSFQMIKPRVRWWHHVLVSSCLYWGLAVLHSFILAQSSQDFAHSIE